MYAQIHRSYLVVKKCSLHLLLFGRMITSLWHHEASLPPSNSKYPARMSAYSSYLIDSVLIMK